MAGCSLLAVAGLAEVVVGKIQAGNAGLGRSALGKDTSLVLVVDYWVQEGGSHL